MPRTPALTRELLEAALVGLELQKDRLDSIRSSIGKRRPGRPPVKCGGQSIRVEAVNH